MKELIAAKDKIIATKDELIAVLKDRVNDLERSSISAGLGSVRSAAAEATPGEREGRGFRPERSSGAPSADFPYTSSGKNPHLK
jgi:hypothetical protein